MNGPGETARALLRPHKLRYRLGSLKAGTGPDILTRVLDRRNHDGGGSQQLRQQQYPPILIHACVLVSWLDPWMLAILPEKLPLLSPLPASRAPFASRAHGKDSTRPDPCRPIVRVCDTALNQWVTHAARGSGARAGATARAAGGLSVRASVPRSPWPTAGAGPAPCAIGWGESARVPETNRVSTYSLAKNIRVRPLFSCPIH